jgi:hypothetical protein
MKKICLLFLFYSITISQAQELIEKCIVDSNGDAIPFVNILLSSGEGLISDVNGRYVLNTEINKDSIISFFHIAYYSTSIKVKLIPDTLVMNAMHHELKGIEISKLNIHKLLTQTFSRQKYVPKGNYLSIRSIGIADSLVYFNEEQLKLTKIDVKEKRIKRKGYGKISYNADSLDSYKINFSIGSTFLNNPYEFYKVKKNLIELINTSKLLKQYPDYYELQAVKDSVKIMMYIHKNSSQLMRFEKTIMHADKSKNNVAYCYNFKLSPKGVVIKSFKYKIVLKSTSSKDPTYDAYLFDILVDDVKKIEPKHFNSLDDLKLLKQKSQLLDQALLPYFRD